MRLPDGVTYHERERRLIAAPGDACIRIDPAQYPDLSGYEIVDRTLADVSAYFNGDWTDLDIALAQSDVVYSGAVHDGDPKLPNITIVPNLVARSGAKPMMVLGSTLGHWHESSAVDCPVQEVYEFQSHGLLVLDREDGEPELWVSQPGDKVSVPGQCHMTLYNLGDRDEPLVTLDFADPSRNHSNKNLLRRFGPILLACYDDARATFTLSRLYIDHSAHSAGVRLGRPIADEERRVHVPLRARLDLGALLYAELTGNPDVIGALARLGLRVKRASPEVALPPRPRQTPSSVLHVSAPLAVATRVGRSLYEYFKGPWGAAPPMTSRTDVPAERGLAAVAAEIVAQKQARMRLHALNRPLVVVVEGAGDWVVKTYRAAFTRIMQDAKAPKSLALFYADDSRWSGTAPAWVSGLRDWETYLDKADAHELALYRHLRPDVVFIVTPDFTHASLAREWLGKTPLVLIEKPFDCRVANVDGLFVELAQRRGTAVLGLDHWLAYALPLHAARAAVVDHLGGALSSVAFRVIEDRPIEIGRERSLQFGLTLDLLPHLLALLTHVADIATLDEIRVQAAGQYSPLVAANPETRETRSIEGSYRAETASAIRFTVEDYSGSGVRVPCCAIVGKGFARAERYIEMVGVNGNAIRLDLNPKPAGSDDSPYPWDSLFFIEGGNAARETPPVEVRDPYDPARTLRIAAASGRPRSHPIDRERYWRLLQELTHGRLASSRDVAAVASTLLPSEARSIVAALDRIWRAIQDARPWTRYPVGAITASAFAASQKGEERE